MRRLAAVFFAGALFASACSSGTSTEPVDLFPDETTTTVLGETATTSITPILIKTAPLADHAIPNYMASEDSFSFANFGGGEAPADLTVNMARRLYGDSQVCLDVSNGQCTPYPVILQLMSQANKSMRGGLCEGLAVLSLRLSGDIETLLAYQNTHTVSQLIKEDPALLSEIAYWYVTQFAMEVQETASAFLEKSPAELAQVLMYDFAEAEKGNAHTGFTIGIYSEMGGHAVTPYRVEEMPSGYRIYIYDSNWPGEERWIDVSKEGQWIYALAATNPTEQAEAWSGGTGTMELTPMRARSGPFTCSFCPKEEGEESGTMLTVAASGDKQMSIKIETSSGDRLGYYDGAFVNEIPGATYRYLISGPSTADPVLVFLPPGIDDFNADVVQIEVPTPAAKEATSSKDRIEALLEEKVEEETQQKFSLLVLNEEKSVQIEAIIVEEEELERWEQPEEDAEPEEIQSLLAFSDDAIEIADIEEATVAIAVAALEVEIELEAGQQIAVTFALEPPAVEPEPTAPGQPEAPAVEPVQDFLNIAIQDDTGEMLAEVEVDLSDYRIEDVEERGPPPTVVPGQPSQEEPDIEPVTVVPLSIEISYDVEAGEIIQEETEIEAWVATDAEYYQAVAEDRIEEVLGESYVEDILEIEEDWEILEVPEEEEIDFAAILLDVDDDYWEDEQWDEVEYDDEWFEEEQELMDELFGESFNVEELFEEVEEFVEEVEEERELFFIEYEMEEEEFWDAVEEENYEDDFAFHEYNPELEEQRILEEMGLEEWNQTLMGPSPTETVDWVEEDWIAYDEEMESIWEEEMEDPALWEEELLEELGIEEWPEDWGPSPTESVEWTEDDWDTYDQERSATDEARILEEEGFDEWPEDWGPSPTESVLWEESDWIAYDEEEQARWEEEEESWELDTEEEWDEWQEEFWPEDADWCDDCEEGPWDDPEWDEPWEQEDWTGEDEEARILEEIGLEEWPEDWGPSPSESWDWEEEDWIDYDEEREDLWEEFPESDWVDDEWSGEDEEAWILEEEGFDEWPEDWGPSPTESWDWTEDDWQEYDEEQQQNFFEMLEGLSDEEMEEWEEELSEEDEWEEPWLEEEWGDEDWTGEDEEQWILEQEGFDEWPEDWGPPPSETWDWTEEQWQTFGEEQEALWEEEWEDNDDDWGEETEEAPSEDALLQDGLEVWPGWDNEEWSGDDEEAWILEQEGFDEWPEDWGPSPSESWDWTEDEWQAFDLEQQELWEDEVDPLNDPEGTDDLDQDAEPGTDIPSETEVDEEQMGETEMRNEEGIDPHHDLDSWSGEDEEGWILDQEGLDEWPEDWGPSPSESWDWEPEDWQAYDEVHGVPPPPEPEPQPEEELWDDPYESCRGTSACDSAPGGYDDWEDYDAANDPAYYDDWGTPPGGYTTWAGFTLEVEAGIVPMDVALEYIPDEVQEVYIPQLQPQPVPAIYYPTITYSHSNTAISETISTSSSTAQTGTTTTTNVTTAESGILTHNSNDGHWHLDTTTETSTATTVTNTLVDTTTVVARTGSDMTTCAYVDGAVSECGTVRGWSPETTTVTVGDSYTQASTTTAVVSATVTTEEGCAEGGWRGMGDWCIVQSSSRQDRDHIQFSLTEVTSVRIDAETNLTRAQFDTSNEAADPYLYLREDTDSDEGDHSGDIDSIAPGGTIETDDDGGRDCGSTCTNPPSSAVDVDETPTITYCNTGGACSNGVPVIDNVSDQWDARIVRTDMAVGNYVVQASVYNPANSGWYRLTIEEDE